MLNICFNKLSLIKHLRSNLTAWKRQNLFLLLFALISTLPPSPTARFTLVLSAVVFIS